MVRVDGQPSAGRLMNVYPGTVNHLPVLHIYVEAPLSEADLWMKDGPFTIEADWKAELGGMMFASQQGLAEILQHCSVHGQFNARVEALEEEGTIAVQLVSVGSLAPLG